MRGALVICVVLAFACSGPVGQGAPHASTSAPNPSAVPGAPASGGVIEYAVPNPSPPGTTCSGCGKASLSGITAGRDGNVWYFDTGRNLVGRVTPTGSITEFPVPGTGAGSEAIVGAPDGNVWMVARTEMNGPNWILKVSPDGVVTRFPLPDGIGPEGITWGPDGNIWFTQIWTGRIGRMTPSGVLTEFPIPSPNSAPRGIVTGPDHNLWFVESSWHYTAIARMTITGVVTEFPLGGTPTDQLQPYNIIAGPDGNLWFNEIGRIGRITPAGEVTQFPMPGMIPSAGLAVAPDGNVWFTSWNAGNVGWISPTGLIRHYPLSRRNAGPESIASGADGRMWFTEAGVSRIASIGLTVPETTFSTSVLNFGSASASAMRTVSVTNTGDGPLRLVNATVAGADHELFVVTGDTCSGHTVAVNAKCSLDIAFKPGAGVGLAAAYLKLVDNATGSPHVVSLLGRLPDCRLPLFGDSHGKFLSLASGQVADDPAGGFVSDNQRFRSQADPVLYGQQPASYDVVAKRWVPAPTNAISPDGARYAYVESQQGVDAHVHVVEISTGRDRTLSIPNGFWWMLAFTTEGIYLGQGYEGPIPGLWLVNADSGAMRTIFSDSVVNKVSGSVAWIQARDASDLLPQPPGMGGANNEVQSRDLNTSKTTTWWYRPGSNLFVLAGAGGSIIVGGYDDSASYLWVVTGPGRAEAITVPETGDSVPYSGSFVADAIGWWLASLDGVYLWTAHTGAILVSASLGAPAGACA